MNSTEIFQLALGLKEPWYIKKVELHKYETIAVGTLNIHIDFVKGGKFKDADGNECKVHDTEERTWQHLNFFENQCYIHARVPRIIKTDGKVETVIVPWSRPGSGFTLLFEAFAMLLIEQEMPINSVAETVRVTSPRIWRVFSHWIKKAISKDDPNEVKIIGIDETSTKKGHNYVTVSVDMEKRRVIHVSAGKGAECVSKLKEHLETKNVQAEQIDQVCIDMSPAFISGVINNFPNAKITFDKFHVVKIINEAMDKVRQLERKEISLLKGHKYTFLRNDKSLTVEQRGQKHELLMAYPRLGEAYRLKELFNEVWQYKDTEQASSFLSFWCDTVKETDIIPFKKAAKTIMAHWSGIVNYTQTRISNGILEGINSKIQLAKKRARGYRNIDNFINMIYFIAGKLKFDYPQYPL